MCPVEALESFPRGVGAGKSLGCRGGVFDDVVNFRMHLGELIAPPSPNGWDKHH